jgi:CheY-like chemotaxis protein
MKSTCTEPTVHRTGPGLGSPIQVLLVEDNPEAAAYISAQVSQNRADIFRVEWKSNILNAVSRLAKPGVHVVLLDLGMPELGGYKTHLAITSAVGKTVPVVILTGDDSTISQDITKAQGAANYLIKHRTSSVELRRALYEAVVPDTAPKAPASPNGESMLAKAASRFLAKVRLK